MQIVPVILGGGSGTRLWPLSRRGAAKQLHALVTDRTMVQETALRLAGRPDVDAPIVVCGAADVAAVRSQLADVDIEPASVIGEPTGRNTAAAIALASLVAGPDDLLLVLPSDAHIKDIAAFAETVSNAASAAADGSIVVFGVTPDRPATGYGYIEPGAARGPVREVVAFHEKPSAELAAAYVASEHSWNAGMFLFQASTMLAELDRHAPALLAAVRAALDDGVTHGDGTIVPGPSFGDVESISIDHAVMELTDVATVIPLDAGWSDVGTWGALADLAQTVEGTNTMVGEVVALDTVDSYLRSTGRTVVAIGVRDLVVVETPDAVLVLHRDATERVKDVVAMLEAEGRDDLL